MKILSPEQIKQCDEFTLRNLNFQSIDLMEKAAAACCDFIVENFSVPDKVIIFCGKGNNGGDGLAIARQLQQQKYYVIVYVIEYTSEGSVDYFENIERFKGVKIPVLSMNDIVIQPTSKSIVIDAVLGNGLNKPLKGIINEVIQYINSLQGYKLAIDIPTGIYANRKTENNPIAFRANTTLSFAVPKLNFMFNENEAFVGNWEILDIGWPPEALQEIDTSYHFTTSSDVIPMMKRRNQFISKHELGHALIIAGSYGKIGAALLSTSACLRSGAGLTTVHIPSCGYEILQSAAPEAMCFTDKGRDHITGLPPMKKYNAVAVGPGIGTNDQTAMAVKELITTCKLPMVIDADAINIIAADPEILSGLQAGTIITPHQREFERLTRSVDSDFERLQLAVEFAKTYQIILVLKGVFTAVINNDGQVYFNSTGNPSLAKGGTGDTLTGIIVAQLAKGYAPLEAAITGVYLHGLSADFCIENKSVESVLATDIIKNLGKAFQIAVQTI